MSNFVTKRRTFAFTLVLTMILTMLMSCSFVFAKTAVATTADEKARLELINDVYADTSGKSYKVDGGGSLKGSDIWQKSETDGSWEINEDKFNTLTSSEQTKFVNDVASSSYASVADNTNQVSESTVQNWWKELQTKNGVGSKFMSVILKDTKPDFVTANAIFKPFNGVIGTVIGVIAIALMAFLGIVLVSDISYIALPPVRMLVADSDEKDGTKPAKSKIFSYDAIYAVECAENNSDGGSGGGKQALGIYLKRRIVMLILLGICLLYLVQGQLYTFVGYVLDIVSGFLGF